VNNSFCNNTCNEDEENCLTPSGTTNCAVNPNGYCTYCQDGLCEIIQGSNCNANIASDLNNSSSNLLIPLAVGLSVGFAIVVFVLFGLFAFCYRKNRRTPQVQSIELSQVHSIEKVVILHKLGGGQFGDVYRGVMNVSVLCGNY
jgi:hypothetical protein